MQVAKCLVPSCDSRGAEKLEASSFDAPVEFIILSAPAPKAVGHSVAQLVVLFGQQQNAAHIGLVVVERVELWGGHMEGPSLREAIVQLLIEREQVHIVHGDVVCAVAALQEAHIDECCPIEPEMVHLVEHIDVVLDPLPA